MKPLAIDLFCGSFGWSAGLVAEGWRVVGFDLEHEPYHGPVPEHCSLVIQDVLTLHGSQFRNADLIVASPPCQAYSYRAMPWSRAKALPPPDNTLFDACFRIQREACEAAGRHIPLIVENVRGAQKWVGRSRWNFGSFHLWGDVPALMPMTQGFMKVGDVGWRERGPGRQLQDKAIKNTGGSWFAVAHNTTSGKGRNPDGRKTSGHINRRDGHGHTRHLTNPAESECCCENPEPESGAALISNECPVHNWNPRPKPEGVKFSQSGAAWFDGTPRDKMLGEKGPAAFGSKSNARKAASAMIARIPAPLARYIAQVFKPREVWSP